MKYEIAIRAYNECAEEIEKIDAAAKAAKAPYIEKQAKIASLIAQAIQLEGLQNAKTPAGTAYFSTLYNCSVENSEVFFNYVQKHERWDLLEKRASKSAVKEEIDNTGEIPPGVKFSAYQKLIVRSV